MGSYKVVFKPSAAKELRGLPAPDLKRLLRKIAALAREPRPAGSEKLVGSERYRLRQGDWRVVYEIDSERRLARVFKIGHRREVYR